MSALRNQWEILKSIIAFVAHKTRCVFEKSRAPTLHSIVVAASVTDSQFRAVCETSVRAESSSGVNQVCEPERPDVFILHYGCTTHDFYGFPPGTFHCKARL